MKEIEIKLEMAWFVEDVPTISRQNRRERKPDNGKCMDLSRESHP